MASNEITNENDITHLVKCLFPCMCAWYISIELSARQQIGQVRELTVVCERKTI